MMQAGAGVFQRQFDVAYALHGLREDVPRPHHLSVRRGGRGSRNVNVIAHAHRARITHYWFPWHATRVIFPLHLQPPDADCRLQTYRGKQPPLGSANNFTRQTFYSLSLSKYLSHRLMGGLTKVTCADGRS